MVTPMQNPDFIYKVVSREVYDASVAAGRFVGQPIDKADGYIHLSTAAQLSETIRLYFAGLTDQVLFQLAAPPLGAALRWEASRNGALFPHLYAELPMSSLGKVARIDVAADGSVELPDWVK
jgi:uncharacterized protein (DUF952 family)